MTMDLIKEARPNATIWLSDPTWPNHNLLAKAAGLTIARYPYFDDVTKGVRFADMMAGLEEAAAGDVVLLHGCRHNPTGADLAPEQWLEVADLAAERGWLPFLDFAYQGFARGIEEDGAAVRIFADRGIEFLVANSFAKNGSVGVL